jgi:hypothetical protein
MANDMTDDTNQPVTRGGLKAELETQMAAAIAPLATKAELDTKLAAAIAALATKAELAAAIAPLATKAELAAAIAPLATKAELDLVVGAMVERIKDEVGRSERRTRDDFNTSEMRLRLEIQASEKRMSAELAQHTGTILEAMQVRISAVDDQYKQLPDRVTVLEKAVFGGGRGSRTSPAAPRPRRRRP